MSKKLQVVGSSLFILAAGCGGGSGDSSENDYSASPAELRALVRSTNDNFDLLGGSYQTSGTPEPFAQTGTVRFDTDRPIPVYFVSANGTEAPAAISQAIIELEARLGDIFTDIKPVRADLSIFRDQNSAGNEPSGTWNEDEVDSSGAMRSKGMKFLAEHGLSYGIAVAIDTGYWPAGADPSHYCANAAIAPYSGALTMYVDPATHLVSNDFVGWVNMGNGACSWGKDMVKHELAHVLGMYNHHYDNDIFGLWSETAMDILATLYANPAGTDYAELVVDQ